MRFPFKVRVLAERLAGKSIFETGYYRESELTRLLNLFAHVDVERWRGLRVLEVGAGLGHLGDAFVQLGFDVTSTDGRSEHVEEMKRRGRQAFVLDLESTGVDEVGEFDLILAFGVLYHLARPNEFLRSCGKRAKVLLLETVVCDRKDPVIEWVTEPGGWRGKDQALHARACRPSPAWVEKACRGAGFASIRDISSPIGNWVIGSFDWEPQDTGETRRGTANLRKMWVCEKER
ncbi:MAG TPA: methyltransferase domain-containing protein [Actinomycetes bacterium]|jgi:SAM-dependent methyltransferase|nr:methyltransferase domain-containing protein [Actinomycetes bacterium]